MENNKFIFTTSEGRTFEFDLAIGEFFESGQKQKSYYSVRWFLTSDLITQEIKDNFTKMFPDYALDPEDLRLV